ncbi:centrosomal protein of 164 kDa-like isoform X1 [Channa argus]|uniref:centrosomal protein of 164 kDa-like isoform X1 n=1 Tax=Channa argus TaxID=215402 RepID=UPI0035203366
MTAAALIGDQLILEEHYDENYIPSEQEVQEYARQIGIDPDNEPELLWLAREGIVVPLPPEWKPCQDVTGEIYYFNFSTGQSVWDHPCDEHYRHLVTQERERAQLTAAGGKTGAKKEKDKKKKKEKKEKKKKESLKTLGTLSSALGPLPSPLGSLAPLRGLDAPGPSLISVSSPPLWGSLANSGGLEPLKTSLGGPRSSGASSALGTRQEERVSLALSGFNDDDNDSDEEKISENEPSPRGSGRLLKNLHLDLDALGGGLQYEDSEASGAAPAEETEPELQDLVLSGEHSPEPSSQQDSLMANELHQSPLPGSRIHISEEGADASTAEAEFSAEQFEQVAAEVLKEVEWQEEENKGGGLQYDAQREKGEDKGGGQAEEELRNEKGDVGNKQEDRGNAGERKSKKESGKSKEDQRGSKASVESRKEEEEELESDEIEEECCEGEDEDEEKDEKEGEETEYMKQSERQESSEREENDSDGKVEMCTENQDDEIEDREDYVERLMEVKEEVDDCDKVVVKSFKSDENSRSEAEDKNDKERDAHEISTNDEEMQEKSEEKEEDVNSKREQEKDKEDEDNESEEALERCSLSQRKLTDSDEEVLERCVQSDRGDTERYGTDVDSDSDGQKLQGTPESEEEVIKLFEMEAAHVRPAKLGQKLILTDHKTLEQNQKITAGKMKSMAKKCPHPAEDSLVCKNTVEASASLDVKLSEKIVSIQDLSGTVSPPMIDDGEKMKDDEADKNKKAEAPKRYILAEDKVSPTTPNVDHLILHQSSPSPPFSSHSNSEQDMELQPKAEVFGFSLGLQRPETSRGRLVRTSKTHLDDAELLLQNHENSVDEESCWRAIKDGEKKGSGKDEEDGDLKGAEREERSLGERKEERKNAEWEVAEERKQMMREKAKKICDLKEELRREEEEEERKIKAESEERLRALRQDILSNRREEEARLTEESDRTLEEFRQSVQNEREKQQQKLREESETILKELHIALEEERAAEREKLEAKKRQDIERLKADSEADLQEERRRLQGENEEKLNSLRQEVKSTKTRKELMSPRPEQHLADYQRELADVLQEVREEVQRDHERKLEQLREDHRREMNNIREKHMDEETVQRERLLSSLREDRERLQASHAVQLEKLCLQLETQLQKAQLTHSRKESELQDLTDQLELRAKELTSQEAMLQAKTADLKRRWKKLRGEEEDMDREIEALPQLIQERDHLKEELQRMIEEKHQARELIQRAWEEKSKAKVDEERLREERDKAREESRRAKQDKEQLESKLALLQERCDYLSQRVSELERGEGASASLRQERKREQKKTEKEATAPSSDMRDSSLHVEDLDDPPLSPVPDSHSSMDEFRHYISSHGASIQKTKLFLERESSRLMERQAALQAVESSSSQDPNQGVGGTEEMIRNLQQEARNVAELQQTVQRGNFLLRRKEGHLQQLESTMGEEPLFEELSRLAGEKKVTFDVTESDLSSSVTGGRPVVPAKVQELANSLQQISGQLNIVLNSLSSLAHKQSSMPYTDFPPSPSQPPTSISVPFMSQIHTLGTSSLAPPPPVRLSESSWNWAPQCSSAATPPYSTPISSEITVSEGLINSRWSQIFPGAAKDPIASSTTRTSSAYPSYTPASEHGHSLRSMQKSVQMNDQRLQGLIDSNKKWLEMRKKDTSIPLFTRYQAPSSKSGLVQLGLDDNNQIRVYHY